MPNQVCCLSESEATDLVPNGVRPDCRAHVHISKKEAWDWVTSDYGPVRRLEKRYHSCGGFQTVVTYHHRSQARWVPGYEGKYLVLEAVRSWHVFNGALQLLPIAAPLGGTRLAQRSNGWPERLRIHPEDTA